MLTLMRIEALPPSGFTSFNCVSSTVHYRKRPSASETKIHLRIAIVYNPKYSKYECDRSQKKLILLKIGKLVEL